MAEDTWYSVSFPILEYVAALPPMTVVNVGTLADDLGFDPMVVVKEVDRLAAAGYLTTSVHKTMTGGDPRPWSVVSPDLGEAGLRAVGAWPSADPYDALVAVLQRSIAAESDPDERSRLQRFASAVADVGKGVVTGVLVELARGGLH